MGRTVAEERFSIPCFRCGVCCTMYQVRLSLLEARRIASVMNLTWQEFLDQYTDPRWPGSESFLLCQRNGACVFLEHVEGSAKTSCLIHAMRPSSCCEWLPGLHRRECQEGLAKYWELAVSASGELQGSRDAIEHFKTFLKSLELEGGISDANL